MKKKYLSSQKINHRYINPHLNNIKRSFKDIIQWKLGYFDDKTPPSMPPDNFVYPYTKKEVDLSFPYVLWINHCSFLIQIEGKHFLTDPIWSDTCSPFYLPSPKRRHKPGIAIQDLPEIDYVLISHDHYDHLDKRSVDFLKRKFPNIHWIVPKDVKKWFLKRNISRVVELDWWEDITYNHLQDLTITITATPTQHFSGRLCVNSNKTLWVGYVVEIKKGDIAKRFYFCGDTGYNAYDFHNIGKKWENMHLSMIPIGTYSPRSFMQPVHVNPEEAVKIHKEVHSLFSIGMHWKTFHLSDEPMQRPPYDLYQAMQAYHIPFDKFIAIDPGIYVNW